MKPRNLDVDPNNINAFVAWVEGKINESPASNLMTIPGIWEILSEEYNNDWIDYCQNSLPEPQEEKR